MPFGESSLAMKYGGAEFERKELIAHGASFTAVVSNKSSSLGGFLAWFAAAVDPSSPGHETLLQSSEGGGGWMCFPGLNGSGWVKQHARRKTRKFICRAAKFGPGDSTHAFLGGGALTGDTC